MDFTGVFYFRSRWADERSIQLFFYRIYFSRRLGFLNKYLKGEEWQGYLLWVPLV